MRPPSDDRIAILKCKYFTLTIRRYPEVEIMAEPDEEQAQARIAASLGEIGFALPGSLVWRTTACGKAGCHCQGDPPVLLGPYLTWTRTVSGKTVTHKISKDQFACYQAWFDNARKLHQLVTDFEALFLRTFEQAEGSSKR